VTQRPTANTGDGTWLAVLKRVLLKELKWWISGRGRSQGTRDCNRVSPLRNGYARQALVGQGAAM